ncbi:endonuclease/exonuclease/phosphatase family protein [Citreimonas sp.]|uniref:endonuclease/exonuclease/phosphatase family protein n=1 Tax=Citreimonas sp. TaxID=3036715 RepID=UPI0035C7B295
MIGNRFEQQIPREQVVLSTGSADLPPAPEVLTVTTWNVGYGGMGPESDFVFDGGSQRRPPEAALVDKNIAGIAETVSMLDSDVLLFQEAARPSWINYGRDLIAVLDRAAGNRKRRFDADIVTRGVPRPWRVEIGNATYFRHLPSNYELVGLPLEPYFQFGLFRKNYRIHVLRFDGEVPWTIANIHLSAFDPEEIDVRRQQVAAVFEFAQAEYSAGRYVVIGGDWNLILSDAAFPHRSAEEHSFWVRDFPDGALPEGWTIAAGSEVPTLRLAYAPYQAGVTRTIAIDGFAVSPNVGVRSVAAQDLGFKWSDHNPVTATFAAR